MEDICRALVLGLVLIWCSYRRSPKQYQSSHESHSRAFAKAFDSVETVRVITIIKQQGISPIYFPPYSTYTNN